MASNIVGYSLLFTMTLVISISLFLFASNYFEKINEILINKQVQDIAYKIKYYLFSSVALTPNSTISYSFNSPYIFLSVVKNTIRIEKKNNFGGHINVENYTNTFDCISPNILDPYSGQMLVKIDDGIYKSTGLNEIFVICIPGYNLTSESTTKSGNYFNIYFKKINKTTIEVDY